MARCVHHHLQFPKPSIFQNCSSLDFPAASPCLAFQLRRSPKISHPLHLLCSSAASSSQSVQDSEVKESCSSIVGDLLDYLNEAWMQFHATAEVKQQLMAYGFHLLSEDDE